MEEKMDFRIISDIANKQEKAGLSLYLIGSMGTISMEESQFLKSLPCACFTSYNIEIGKLMKLMEKNDVTKKRILVVDDEPILLRSIKGWLSDDFEVFLVNSGDTAIEFLNTHPVDLVLLDYRMPGMDGPDVLRRIRADVDFQNLPVMFLTANNDKESIVNIMHLEPNGYILKSMSPDEIKKSIKEFFKNHRYKVFS
jgi:CheY-like chemotaxis protein